MDLHYLKKLILLLTLLITTPSWAATELRDEGSSQGYINVIDCVGAGVSCTRSGIVGTATINGGGGAGNTLVSGDNIFIRTIGTTSTISADGGIGSFSATIDGTTGPKGFIPSMPYAFNAKTWTIMSTLSCDITVDVMKAAFPSVPDGTNTITGTEKLRLNNQQVSQDNTLTTWNTTINAGDVILVSVDAVNACPYVNLVVSGDRVP